MNSCKTLSLLILLYYIFNLPQRFSADGEPNKSNPELVHQTTSPSPSPVPGNGDLAPGDAKVDVKSKSGQVTCELVHNKCHDDSANVTACVLPYAGDGSMGLIVLNEGDDSVKFDVTVLPLEPTYDNIEVLAHEVRKINVSATASSSSVVLKSINWTCKIQLGVPIPPGIPVPLGIPYAEYVTPINGAYVLLGTAVLIGMMWACCKLGKHRRHSDGIPYQELEMGQAQSTSSLKVETASGWDQDWDDDWDEERAVRSPGGNRIGNRRANGGSSRLAESNGWDDDWKD